MNTIPLVLERLAELAMIVGVAPLNKLPGCWEYEVDERWAFAFNGHPEPKASKYCPAPVLPFSVYVQFNGWPAGVIDPTGGVFAAGDAANEDAFIDAIEEAIARVRKMS